MTKEQTFTVTAKGSLAIAQPYEYEVRVTSDFLSLDGRELSWNDALAAFEAAITYRSAEQQLFPTRRRRERAPR